MKNILRTTIATSLISLSIISCKDEDKNPANPIVPSNPTEIITSVKLILIEDGTGNTITATWNDADGDGPLQPVISALNLTNGKNYSGVVLLLDESKTPVDTISNEVEEELNEHQFFYTLSGDASTKISFTKDDKDDNNLPVGLKYRVVVSTGTASAGTLKVTLKHYDGINKSADVSVGETDVEANFPVNIQ